MLHWLYVAGMIANLAGIAAGAALLHPRYLGGRHVVACLEAHSPQGETVFVTCEKCGAEESFHSYYRNTVSDAEATQRFEALGWSVVPQTLCPKHAASAPAALVGAPTAPRQTEEPREEAEPTFPPNKPPTAKETP